MTGKVCADEVTVSEQSADLAEHGFRHGTGRKHQPEHTWCVEGTHCIGDRGTCRDTWLARECLARRGVRVDGGDEVTTPSQSTCHVAAHAAKTYERQFHVASDERRAVRCTAASLGAEALQCGSQLSRTDARQPDLGQAPGTCVFTEQRQQAYGIASGDDGDEKERAIPQLAQPFLLLRV